MIGRVHGPGHGRAERSIESYVLIACRRINGKINILGSPVGWSLADGW